MNTSNETECLAETLLPALGLVAISLLQATLNGFVSVAVMINRKKLKNNSVYLYVLSMLAANVVFGIFSGYGYLNIAYGFERIWTPNSTYRIIQSDPRHIPITTWRGFRTALTICMYLVMSANVSTVMIGLRQSSYFVGPVAMPQASDTKERSTSPSEKRRKAIVLVSLTWLVPLVLATIVANTWNCLNRCVCFDAYYPSEFSCRVDVHNECNAVFNSMRNDFMIFVAVTWLFFAVVIGVMLFTTVQKYKQATNVKMETQINTVSADLSDNNDILDREAYSVTNYPKSESSPENIENSTKIEQEVEHPLEDEAKETTPSCWSQVTQLGYTVKAMILISVLFILCLSPSMIVILLDSSSVEYVMPASLICFSGVTVYCIACPLILVYYMPGLRRAISSVFYKWKCCTRTTVTHRSKTDSQESAKEVVVTQSGNDELL